jgi:hypothetical protein
MRKEIVVRLAGIEFEGDLMQSSMVAVAQTYLRSIYTTVGSRHYVMPMLILVWESSILRKCSSAYPAMLEKR